MNRLYVTQPALSEQLMRPVTVRISIAAYHDPKGKVDCQKGPRSKYEQKTSVEPLSVTWAYRAVN